MFLRSRFSVRSSQVILLGVFVLSLPAVTTRIYASDEVEGFAWLHSLAFDRDVSFENEYRYFYDSGQVKNPAFHETFLESRLNFTTMGSAILWAPFYAVGHVIALSTGAPADGLGQPYVAAVAIGSACYGFAALLLSAAMARRIVGNGLSAAVAVWIGTPLLFYMYVTPVFAHACSAFAVALFVWTWLRVRASWSLPGAVGLGLAGGLMMMVRAQDAIFIAGPALDFARWALAGSGALGRDRPGPKAWGLGPALAGTISFLAAYTPQLLAYQGLNGHLRLSVEETRKMTWTSPHRLQVLFDHEHGLFFWTPLALVAAAGLVMLAIRPPDGPADSRSRFSPGRPQGTDFRSRRADMRWIGFCALVMFALQAYIAGAVESWTVAGAFGQRRFVSLTPLLVLGLATVLAIIPRRRVWPRAITTAVIVACIWWNLGLMALFGLHQMDRQRLTLGDNAWRTFVALPRDAPAIAWRYFTDRSSFYEPSRR